MLLHSTEAPSIHKIVILALREVLSQIAAAMKAWCELPKQFGCPVSFLPWMFIFAIRPAIQFQAPQFRGFFTESAD
jgi:hypothetical protein